MHPALPALSLVCLTSLATAVQAQDSRITLVTVYPGSATVQRTLQVPPGARQAVRRLGMVSALQAPTASMAARWSAPVNGWAKAWPRLSRKW